MEGTIRKAEAADIDVIVELSERKRLQYQSYQPFFWSKAEDSREKQAPFLLHQLSRDNVIALVHERQGEVDGFVIATLVPSPPVYAAGLTCAIDDYCVTDHDWSGVGQALLQVALAEARERGAAQCVVVCGHMDEPKRALMRDNGLSIASEWWVKPLG